MIQIFVRYQLLAAVNIKMTVLWDVPPCTVVIALMMELIYTSETSVNLHHITRREPNVIVESLALLIRILKVPGSNLGPETILAEIFRGFHPPLQENARIVP
jgi:hypothetical protein